jgi:hypothetical protein
VANLAGNKSRIKATRNGRNARLAIDFSSPQCHWRVDNDDLATGETWKFLDLLATAGAKSRRRTQKKRNVAANLRRKFAQTLLAEIKIPSQVSGNQRRSSIR